MIAHLLYVTVAGVCCFMAYELGRWRGRVHEMRRQRHLYRYLHTYETEWPIHLPIGEPE